MFEKVCKFIRNIKPIYKIILIAAVIVIVLLILLSIGFSNHYYTIKCRDDIEDYSSKLYHCTSDVFGETDGFRQLELSLIQYNFTRWHGCDLGFTMMKCLNEIQPIDEDCDEKPAAERLLNILNVVIETIQFLCIDSFDDYIVMAKTNFNVCHSELLNYDQCIKEQQSRNNVTELNSFLNRNLCRNFNIKMSCNRNFDSCFSSKQQHLVNLVYRHLKLSFLCP